MKASVLVIEDDPHIRAFVKDLLSQEGFQVFLTENGTKGLDHAEKIRPEIILLDLLLPDISGEYLFRELKEKLPETPVIMLTAKGAVSEIVKGLKLGADDYIPKPFAPEELVARMRARLKNASRNEDNATLVVADLTLDTKTHDVKRGGKHISLTKTEYNLLEYFMRNVGRVLTRDNILSQVWSYSPEVETRTVDVYVGYLRRKIDRSFKIKLISSVRGFGYVMKAS